MKVDAFDFDLPDDLVALRPAEPRDSCRLLVVHGDGRLEHRRFTDIVEYLDRPDSLLLNDTQVFPARLRGMRQGRGDPLPMELLLHRRLAPNRFSAMARPLRRLRAGDRLELGPNLTAQVDLRREDGMLELRFPIEGAALDAAIAAAGEMPLPPYIASKRPVDARDQNDYQTVYAARQGSVAAPTAGLHFTQALLAQLAAKGVEKVSATLHVGLGTFLPVKSDDTQDHRMHPEWGELSVAAAQKLNETHDAGGRIVAVGTTAMRLLESAATPEGRVSAYSGDTDIFITPGYRIRAVDALVTNFHLPRSTLFMLTSGLMGLEAMQAAYAEAIAQKYRFYSYGDACLLIPSHV